MAYSTTTWRVVGLASIGLMMLGCPKSNDGAGGPSTQNTAAAQAPLSIELSSSNFAAGKAIPRVHTCEGEDAAPALSWRGVPAGTKSLALIVDDPDAPDPAAPKMTWVHWVLFNIPPDATEIPAGAGKGEGLPQGTKVGKNDWKRADFGGPCPPTGRHRYFHKLYALDVTLDLNEPTKAELEQAMAGHVLARGELIGTYQKGDP